MIRSAFGFGLALLAATLGAWQPAAAGQDSSGRIPLVFPPLPSPAFVSNGGQWPDEIRFAARAGSVAVVVKQDRLELQFGERVSEEQALSRAQRMDLRLPGPPGAWSVAAVPQAGLPGYANFLLGPDPAAWATRVPLHDEIEYRSEATGARWTVRLNASGAGLEFRRSLGSSAWSRDGFPEGVTHEARMHWDVLGQELIETQTDSGFSFDWAAYITGSTFEGANDATFTEDGGVVTVGRTTSTDFLTTIGEGPQQAGVNDAFVVKFDAATAEFRYSTVLGGSGGDVANVVKAAHDGDVVLAGSGGAEFPVTPGAYDTTYDIGENFIARLAADGTRVLHATYFGGTGGVLLATIESLAVDIDQSIVIVGHTDWPDLPVTTGAFQSSLHPPPFGQRDGYILRFTRELDAVQMCTYFGGIGAWEPFFISGSDQVYTVATCRDSSILIGGRAAKFDFPITPGAFDPTPHIGNPNFNPPDAFVAKLSGDGTTLLASTYIGFTGTDQVFGVMEDPLGRIVVVGSTESSDFPTTPDAFQPVSPDFGGSIKRDGYVMVLSGDLTTLEYSSFIGSCCLDHVRDVHVDGSGVVTMYGVTEGTFDFPITAGSYGVPWGRGFLLRLHPDLDRLLYSAKIGAGVDGDIFTPQGGMSVHPLGGAAAGFQTVGMNAAGVVRTPFGPPQLTPLGNPPSSGLLSVVTMLPTGVARFGTASETARGPIAMGVLSMPFPGNAGFGVTVTQGPDSARGLLAFSAAALSTALPLQGTSLWLEPSAWLGLLPIVSDTRGWSETRLPLPADAALEGFTFHAQTFWPPSGPGATWLSSNALRITVQPALP